MAKALDNLSPLRSPWLGGFQSDLASWTATGWFCRCGRSKFEASTVVPQPTNVFSYPANLPNPLLLQSRYFRLRFGRLKLRDVAVLMVYVEALPRIYSLRVRAFQLDDQPFLAEFDL